MMAKAIPMANAQPIWNREPKAATPMGFSALRVNEAIAAIPGKLEGSGEPLVSSYRFQKVVLTRNRKRLSPLPYIPSTILVCSYQYVFLLFEPSILRTYGVQNRVSFARRVFERQRVSNNASGQHRWHPTQLLHRLVRRCQRGGEQILTVMGV